MSILSAVSSSVNAHGIRAVIAGVEKVGKTTLACGAPRPLLIPLEVGYGGIQVAKTPMLDQFAYVIALLDEIAGECAAQRFAYKTIIVDSGTALERLIHNATLATDPSYGMGNKKALTMEAALGGYGKAYQYANELFETFLRRCDLLAINYGVNVVITCHVFAAKVVDPTSGEYDTWDLLLHSPKNQKNYGKRELLTQWADLIGFLHDPVYVVESVDKNKISRAVSANKGRILGVVRTPGYVAGNRYNISQEIPIPATGGWNHLANAIYQSSRVDVFNRD